MSPQATSSATDMWAPPNEGVNAERENPQQTTSSGARTYGFNPDGSVNAERAAQNIDLPEELQNALLCLVQEAQREELYQRRIEVMRDRRNRFYERGLQHIYEDIRTGIFVQGTPGAWVPDPSGDGQLQCGNYISDYNIFGRALQIIIAKLTENPAGVDFQPDSGDSSVDLQASQAAEAYRLLYDRRNDSKDLLTAIVRMMGVSGRTVTWTRTMADRARWGTDEQGAPRRVQTTTVYGTLETKVPIIATGIAQCPYILISEDPHVFIAKQEHPEFADKIMESGEEGIADTQFERLARLGALQGNSASFQITDTYDHYTERKYGWFRQAMFTDKSLDSAYADIDAEGNPRQVDMAYSDLPRAWTLRDALLEAFPDGCQVTFVGNQYVGSRNACIDDELAIDFPYVGDGMSRMAVMDPAVVIQDRFNDDMNAYAEVKDFGWPSTWCKTSKVSLGVINDQVASPYCFRALPEMPPREYPMEDQFFREPDPLIPPTFMQHTEYLATQLLQFILAIPSAVQGAGMPDQKTASGYNAAIQQAMGQLGVIWGAVQRLMSKIYRQAALAASRDEQDPKALVIPTKKGNITLQMADLGKGHFLAHPDIDSGYPESTMQKRSTISMIFDLAVKDPAVGQAVFQSPDNWDFFSRTFGISEMTFPEARVRRKQLAEIELLIQQAPAGPTPEEEQAALAAHDVGAQQAVAAGLPAPPPFDPMSLLHSTITPDPLDYHDWEFEMCKEKLSDYAWVQQQLTAGNSAGIENLRLHAHEHQKYVIEEAAAQMKMQQAAHPPAAHRPPPPRGAQPPGAEAPPAGQ